MDEDENESAELARLRGLGAWMRDVGATELELGDLRIKLAPKPPAAPGRALSARDPDEQVAERAAEAEGEALDADEAAHYALWRRITRSSGAPIPAFRPRKAAPQ